MKNKVSLRQLAKQLGVSVSYLSQVKNGKRPPSQKLLSSIGVIKLLNVKHDVDADTSKGYNPISGSVAQVVEQGTHKPLVAGSTPAAAIFHFRPIGLFLHLS
jgi:transcriptional regulator with XRE-family HTH domain